MASTRLKNIATHIPPPAVEAPEKALPAYDELPMYKNFPGCAWAVWGADDQLGTVNLLTRDVVQRAVAEEVRYVYLPLSR